MAEEMASLRSAGSASAQEIAGFTALLEQDLTRFGIGGYYMVKRAESSFGPGKANTVIQAQWTHQAGSADPPRAAAAKVGEKPEPKKCRIGGAPQGDGTGTNSRRQEEQQRYLANIEVMAEGANGWEDRVRGAIDILTEDVQV